MAHVGRDRDIKVACGAVTAKGTKCPYQGYVEVEGYKFCTLHARVYNHGEMIRLARRA